MDLHEKFKSFLARNNKTVWLTACQVSGLFGKGKPILHGLSLGLALAK